MNKEATKKLAVITGASSGIGERYARELFNRDFDVILVARRTDRLQSLSAELLASVSGERKAIPLYCDLSKRPEIDSLAKYLIDSNLVPDLLVNNAGFGSLGAFVQSDLAWEQTMVDVNCVAPLTLIHHLLPEMIKRGFGQIVNVCSTCSFQPMPTMATYGATKSFLFSLSLALNTELKSKGIHVMAHCPGPTSSEFHKVVGLPQKLDWLPGMQPDTVVEQALCALEKGKPFVVNGYLNCFLAQLSRHLPPMLSSRIVAFILRNHF